MTSHLSPTNRFLPLYSAIGGVVLLAASTRFDSFLGGLCLGAGSALLVLAIVMVVRLRAGADPRGWRPSQEVGTQTHTHTDTHGGRAEDRDLR